MMTRGKSQLRPHGREGQTVILRGREGCNSSKAQRESLQARSLPKAPKFCGLPVFTGGPFNRNRDSLLSPANGGPASDRLFSRRRDGEQKIIPCRAGAAIQTSVVSAARILSYSLPLALVIKYFNAVDPIDDRWQMR
jgi:hypothetical protein